MRIPQPPHSAVAPAACGMATRWPETSAPASGTTSSSQQSFDQEHAQVEAQVDSVEQDLKHESPAKQGGLAGELAMLKARKNLLDTMSDFLVKP